MAYKIDETDAAAVEPARPAAGTLKYFSTAIQTRVRDWWLNMVQNEICNFVTSAGLALDKDADNQLWLAFQNSIATTGAKGIIEIATQEEVDVGTDTSRAVVPSFLRSSPFYNIKVNDTSNLTLPSEFTGNIAEASLPSFGSIDTGATRSGVYSSNSMLYVMSVEVYSARVVPFKLFRVDDSVYIYVDGVLKASRVGAYSSSSAPLDLSFTLNPGDAEVQIVKNDSGGGTNTFQILGDIMGTNVAFNG